MTEQHEIAQALVSRVRTNRKREPIPGTGSDGRYQIEHAAIARRVNLVEVDDQDPDQSTLVVDAAIVERTWRTVDPPALEMHVIVCADPVLGVWQSETWRIEVLPESFR